MTSRFDLTWFYGAIIRNSVFQLGFFNSGIPDPIILFGITLSVFSMSRVITVSLI